MPWLVMALIGGLSRFVPYVVAKILVALGLGVVTYTSLTYVAQTLANSLGSLQQSIPGDVLALLRISGIMGVMQLLLSAYTVRITLDAASKVVQKI